MIKQMIVVFSGSALLIAVVVAIVIASRSLRQPVPLPEAPVAQTPAGVRVKAVERRTERDWYAEQNSAELNGGRKPLL